MKTKGKQIEIEISNTKNKLTKYLRTYRSRFFYLVTFKFHGNYKSLTPLKTKKRHPIFLYIASGEEGEKSHFSMLLYKNQSNDLLCRLYNYSIGCKKIKKVVNFTT